MKQSFLLAALAAATLTGCQPANRQSTAEQETSSPASESVAGTRTVKLSVPNMT
jgi:Prokaryotic membrane lipoprotein lipid attachment site